MSNIRYGSGRSRFVGQGAFVNLLDTIAANHPGAVIVGTDGQLYYSDGGVWLTPQANLDESRALNIVAPALSGSAATSALAVSQTWNTTGTPTLFKMNLTDAASDAASLLMDFVVGGSSQFSVSKAGDLAAKTLTLAGQSLTGSQATSLADLATTWNTTGTPTAIKLNVTDTASNAASLLLDLRVGGTSRFSVSKTGVTTVAAGSSSSAGLKSPLDNTGLAFASNVMFLVRAGQTFARIRDAGIELKDDTYLGWSTGGADLRLSREAANILAQRNDANAQTFRIYNTYTDGSNYERGRIGWSSNILRIGTEKAGTGTARALELQTDGTTRLAISDTGAVRLGPDDAATPSAQTLSVQSVVAGTSNTAGATFTIRGSQGTGTGAGGNIVFQTAPAGSSGTAQNALLTALTISKNNTGQSQLTLASSGGNCQIAAEGNSFTILSGNHDVVIPGLRAQRQAVGFGIAIGGATNDSGIGAPNAAKLYGNPEEGANIIGQRNGVNAQTFRVYRSYTDASNYSRLAIRDNQIASEVLGTGSLAVTVDRPVLNLAQEWNAPTVTTTGASGTGTTATLTFATQTSAFPVGSTIVVAGVTPTGYNGTYVVTASTTGSVSYANATTGSQTVAGTVQQRMVGLQFNATDTASNAGSRLLDLLAGGSSKFSVTKAGDLTTRVITTSVVDGAFIFSSGSANLGNSAAVVVSNFDGLGTNNGRFQWVFPSSIGVSATGTIGLGTDVKIWRDAANVLAQRNGVNAQTFRIYNTYTDGSNFERGYVGWSSNILRIGTEKAGTGVARSLELQTDGTTRLTIAAAGDVTLTNNLQFGGTTSSFPALKRSSTELQVRLADDSGFATVKAGGITIDGQILTSSISLYQNETPGVTYGKVLWAGPNNTVAIARNGFAQMYLRDGTVGIVNALGWNVTDSGVEGDLLLRRDAAGILAQRNGVNAQESRIYGSHTSATNFQRVSTKTVRESSGTLSGASYTTTIAIPAYAHLVGVTTRVMTEITGATTYDVGDGSDVDLWGAAIGITVGTASRTADFTAVGAVGAAATSRTITLTANGSNFTGGVVEICAHYLFTEAD